MHELIQSNVQQTLTKRSSRVETLSIFASIATIASLISGVVGRGLFAWVLAGVALAALAALAASPVRRRVARGVRNRRAHRLVRQFSQIENKFVRFIGDGSTSLHGLLKNICNSNYTQIERIGGPLFLSDLYRYISLRNQSYPAKTSQEFRARFLEFVHWLMVFNGRYVCRAFTALQESEWQEPLEIYNRRHDAQVFYDNWVAFLRDVETFVDVMNREVDGEMFFAFERPPHIPSSRQVSIDLLSSNQN